MKKYVRIMLVVLMVAGFFFTGIAKPASAFVQPPPPPPPPFLLDGIAAGSWTWTSSDVAGSEIAQDTLPASPYSWLQLLTNGLKIDSAAKICHPFKGGRFGWTGEIRQLVDGKWVKLATTNAWVPSEEGVFMSCAQAPAAGTYALFGSYNQPEDYQLPSCRSINIPSYIMLDDIFTVDSSTLGFGDIYGGIASSRNAYVRYQVIDSNYPLIGDLVGSMMTDGGGYFDFHTATWYGPNESNLHFTIRVSSAICYIDWYFYGTP